MIRKLVPLVILALASFALVAVAAEEAAKKAPSTLTGEVVDTGCYLGHAARGEKHISCATKCISNGMPMGLLTSNGKLYLILLNHDNADPYNQLKEMAGKTVTLTGVVNVRSGMQGIDVTDVKLAAVEAAK